jgi:hypothetical protein
VKWSEVKWSEVKWSEVKWSEVKWSEVKWTSCWFLALLILRPWTLRRHVPPKRQLTFNALHAVISPKDRTLRSHSCEKLRSYNLITWHNDNQSEFFFIQLHIYNVLSVEY